MDMSNSMQSTRNKKSPNLADKYVLYERKGTLQIYA